MSRPHREPSRRKGTRRTVQIAAAFAVACVTILTLASAASAASAAAPPGAAPPAPPPSPSPSPSAAKEPITPVVELRHDLWIDVPVTLGVVAGTAAWTFVRKSAVPVTCALCDGSPGHVDAVDDFFRGALRRRDPAPAIFFSDVFGYGLAPLSALGLGTLAAVADRRGDEALLDGLLVVEATAIDLAIDQVFLATVRRERPDFHFLDEDAREAARSANALSSFPSGHVSAAFAMAASAGTVASMRGYRIAPLVWIVGGVIGVTTGYLRMAGDRHYFTDVMSGAAIGTLTGIGVPLLFHSPEKGRASGPAAWLHDARIASAPVPGGRLVTLGWLF